MTSGSYRDPILAVSSDSGTWAIAKSVAQVVDRGLARSREMRRVVVTGLGMVTPLACGVEPTWQRLIAARAA